MHVKLILSHQLAVILLFDSFFNLVLGQVDSEVEIAEKHFYIMIIELIVLELGASFSLERLIVHISQLLLTLLYIARTAAAC